MKRWHRLGLVLELTLQIRKRVGKMKEMIIER